MTRFLLPSLWLLATLSLARIPARAQQPAAPANIEELKNILHTEMEKQHVAGMMLTLVKRDTVLLAAGLGMADYEKKRAVTENVLFRGSSITKLFVAAAVLNLVKQGKLRLDSRLRDIAPDIRFHNKWEEVSPVTIDKLLEHSTGFSDKSPFEEYNFSSRQYTGLEALAVFEKYMSSKWRPGERHAYSGVNYAVLDYVIERVSGKTTNDYVKEEVFAKLGMAHTNLNLTDDDAGLYSRGYIWDGRGFSLVPHQPAFSSGYSSLNINAADAARGLKMFLNGWEQPYGKFLSREFLEDSETPHTYLSAKAGLRNTYAYGNESHELDGTLFRGHRGAIGGFLLAFLYNRQLRVGYAFALNTHNEEFYRFADRLISRYLLGNAPKPVPAEVYPLHQKAVDRRAGYYRYANPSQLYSGFFERLTNTIHVSKVGQFLDVSIIGRGQMRWQATDREGRFYKHINAIHPHIVFLNDSAGNPAISDGTMYFEKISLWQAWIPIILFIVSAVLMISAIGFGVVNAIVLILKKAGREQWVVRLMPGLASLSLLLSLYSLSQLFEHMKEALPMDGLHTAWTIGNYGFALFMMFTCIQLGLKWKYLRSWPLKIYLCCASGAGVYFIWLLASNHWFF
ncbi:serine hydrolase [Dyadobacter sp. CY351]|uniref:serine hydrolase domain-containing protein n=1 Tax=Dyadobacter sp. CY351 TaxID=2909337 RepID=UPI001F1C1F11|nr:serine hydrolase domain-containing protein [Dyadobacter sp. CY351]MCF2517563.1 beta-lactamase family protein [Dyadobacter sp. CY351]